LVFSAVVLVLWLIAGWTWVAWFLPVIVIGFLIAIAIEPRRVRSIGYSLRDDDLIFRRGIMFQRFVREIRTLRTSTRSSVMRKLCT
ncbi:hypothetical protein ACC691_39920, partial [Rhizobium johnstonii]|uniref:hypothetical protein n=1 Tax=Rhizobium johnstonii TaxID=3019933 RepID=UPI003F9D005C